VKHRGTNRSEVDEAVTGVDPLEPKSRRTTPARQRMRRRTGSGDRALDEKIRAVVQEAGAADADLLEDLVMTAFRTARTADRGEMKLLSRSFRELGRAFRIFAPYKGRRKVSIFGSARTVQDDAEYRLTQDFAAEISRRGWMVITGAGPGIMAAGHEGAGAENSFGVGIKLPIEQGANEFIAGDSKFIDFKYFFTRKIMFMKESDAFVLLPGGFGTLDEAFELLTLMQTGKTSVRPVILLQPPGDSYWTEWDFFVREHLVDRGLVSPEDVSLLQLADTIDEAVGIIERFYGNYQSARYVGDRLVLRMLRMPPPRALERLNADFADIVASGRIEPIRITPAEAEEGDSLEMQRLGLYPEHNYARLRQLIDALNEH
jgi:uncharacterized protein (TIGR00730 family)